MAWGDRQPIKARPMRVPTTDTRSVKPPPKVKDPWLYTPEHKAWSKAVIARSGGMCQDPEHDPKRPRSGIRLFADHLIERRDDDSRAALLGPGLCRCGSCHTRVTLQRRAVRMGARFSEAPKVAASWYPEWLHHAVIPFYVVCGPPASGKNTFVASCAGIHDLVIDMDEIMGRLPCDPTDKAWLNVALRERNEMLGELTRRGPWQAAYLISGEPLAERRQWWTDKMGARVYLLTTPREVCEARIMVDSTRPQADLLAAIDRWFSAYTPRTNDFLITEDNVDA